MPAPREASSRRLDPRRPLREREWVDARSARRADHGLDPVDDGARRRAERAEDGGDEPVAADQDHRHQEPAQRLLDDAGDAVAAPSAFAPRQALPGGRSRPGAAPARRAEKGSSAPTCRLRPPLPTPPASTRASGKPARRSAPSAVRRAPAAPWEPCARRRRRCLRPSPWASSDGPCRRPAACAWRAS